MEIPSPIVLWVKPTEGYLTISEGKKMKKVLIGTLTVVLVLTAITAGAFAAGRGQGSRFVDADSNGICDNYAAYCKGTGYGTGYGAGYVDVDNDGVCDNCGTNCQGTGCGLGFVDADNDGVCDNYASGCQGTGCGSGWGHGSGRGGHHGGWHS